MATSSAGFAFHWPYRFVSSTRTPDTRRAILNNTSTCVILFSVVTTLVAVGYSYLATSSATVRKKKGQATASPVPISSRLSNGLARLTGSREPPGTITLVAIVAAISLYLVQWNTSDDYQHIARSPAQIAVALLPSTVALSLPPIRAAGLARVLSVHKLQALLLFGLLSIHAALYVNLWVQNGVLGSRLRTSIVAQLGFGMVAVTCVLWYSGARIASVRASLGVSNARALHVTLSLTLAAMLWFHVTHARRHILAAAAFWTIGIAWRTGGSVLPKSRAKRESKMVDRKR